MPKNEFHHCHFGLPIVLWKKIEEVADRRKQTTTKVIQTIFKVGLLALDTEDTVGEEPLFKIKTFP